ncbi:MAG: hypothetical protein KAI47_00640, partial [Deltaproteobacteria bacterium]|nr:hypothetical protein [Deltaproteobacteria bacterium]
MFAAALHLTAEGTLGKYRGPLRAAHPWTWKEARAQHICFGDDAAAFITTPWGWVLATGRLDVPLAHNAGEIAAHIANLHTTSRAPEAWLADLRGAFAFAIWNEPKQTLYCVRDHFGVEPLYYLHEGDVFAFASESHLLRPLAHDPRIDKEYLAEYLLAVNTRPQRTIYAAVNTLLGATLLELRRKHLTLRRYWTPKPKLTERHAPLSMHIAALRETFRRAVHRRVGDKTALGLSAGLDSGSIAAFLPPRDKPYPAITLHFPNSDADETHLMGAYATDPRLAWHKLEELPRVADSERQLLHPDGPAIEPNAMFFLALTAAAAQLDSTIFL